MNFQSRGYRCASPSMGCLSRELLFLEAEIHLLISLLPHTHLLGVSKLSNCVRLAGLGMRVMLRSPRSVWGMPPIVPGPLGASCLLLRSLWCPPYSLKEHLVQRGAG